MNWHHQVKFLQDVAHLFLAIVLVEFVLAPGPIVWTEGIAGLAMAMDMLTVISRLMWTRRVLANDELTTDLC